MELITNSPWLVPAGIALLALLACIGVMAMRLGRAGRRLRVVSASLRESDNRLVEQGDQLASLTGLMQIVNEQADPNDLIRSVLAQLQTLVSGAEAVSVLMRRNDEGPFIIRASTYAAPSSSFYLSEAEAQARYQETAERIDEQVFLVRNTAGLPGNERVHQSELARSLLVFRMGDAQRLDGYVVLGNHRYTDAFDMAELQRMGALREHLAAAFDKLRLMESLRLAREATNQALRFKGAFLANISHEIRTPMNAIIGFSRLGEDVERLDQARGYLRKIGDAGNTLLSLVNDVLDLSTIEAGRLELEPLHFDLRDELERLNDMFEQRALEKGIALRTKLDAAVPQVVFGDALRIRQILVHLIGNAVKFTQRGRIDVRVHADASEDDGLMLQFSVKDTGIGLDPKRAESLFEAFGQGEDGTTRRFGGTGLGLSIAQQLVRLMGGDIHVDSELGRGSTFTVDLRVAKGDPTKVAPAASADANLDALLGLRVLLVEDNAVNQEVASRILGRIGVRTTVASSGQRAIELAAAERFDAVLMDVHMPGLDGYQTTQGIRALPERQDLPIIALTAHAVAGYRERCLKAGMNDYLTKPVEPDTLYRALLRWTRGLAPTQPEIEQPEVAVDAAPPVRVEPSAMATGTAELASLTLPGFDTIGALRRVGGEQAFYRRLLSAFVDDFADMNPQLRRHMEAGETEQAKRLLHSFKGVAATVGADELAEMALNMERVLASESKVDMAVLGEFETAFRWACASIREIAGETASAASTGLDDGAIDQDLVELAARLKRSDPTCDTLWEALRPQLGEGFDAKLVKRLDNELHAFAFRAAADTVAQLREGRTG